MGKKKKSAASGIVYSTNPDFQPWDDLPPASAAAVSPGEQDLRIWKEFHGGKAVTVVRNFSGPETALAQLGKELRLHCGAGGTVKHGEILIQGDQREKVIRYLSGRGYRLKKAGG
jgi:translation initiation factor 1